MDEKDIILDETTELTDEVVTIGNTEVIAEIETQESKDTLTEESAEVAQEVLFEDETLDNNETEVTVDEDTDEFSSDKKKKNLLDKSIIIATVIVGVVAVVLGALSLLRGIGVLYDPSVVGVWKANDESMTDGMDCYYIFDKDGTFTSTIDSVSSKGTWSEVTSTEETTATDESGEAVSTTTIQIVMGGYPYEYTYSVDGGAFKDRTLVLGELPFTEVKSAENNMTLDGEVKTSDELTGKWVNEANSYSYEFFTDGRCVMNQSDMIIIEGYYDITEEGSFNLIYEMYGENTESQIPYELNDNVLTMQGGLEFTKVEE